MLYESQVNILNFINQPARSMFYLLKKTQLHMSEGLKLSSLCHFSLKELILFYESDCDTVWNWVTLNTKPRSV